MTSALTGDLSFLYASPVAITFSRFRALYSYDVRPDRERKDDVQKPQLKLLSHIQIEIAADLYIFRFEWFQQANIEEQSSTGTKVISVRPSPGTKTR